MGEENRQIIELNTVGIKSKDIKENITLMKNALNSSINAIAISNFEGKLMYINPAFLRMWGYDDEKDVLGRFSIEFWQNKDLASKVLIETQKKGSWFGELVAQKRDGKNLNIEVSTSVIRNKSDEVCGIIASFVDNTQQKKAEEALQKSKKRFQDVALCSADWIWETDREARYTFASGKVKEILGYEVSELIGKTPFELMPEKEAKHIGEVFKKISFEKKPIIDLENWNLTKQGKKVCLLTNGIPILDENGNLTGYRGVDKDITKHKKAQEELEAEKKKLEIYIESMIDGVAITDVNGTIVHANKTWIRMLGCKSPKEVIGKTLFEFLAKREVPRCRKRFFESIKNKEKVVKNFEVIQRRKDGSEFCILLNNTSLWDKEGKYIAGIAVLRDITEQKKIEKELVKYRYHLEELVKKRTAELEHTNQELDSVINSASEIIIAFNRNSQVTAWNKSVELLTGYKQREVIGKDISNLHIFDNLEDITNVRENCLNNSYPTLKPLEIKSILNTKKRNRIIVNFSISSIRDNKGQYKGCLFIGKDITSDLEAHGKLLMGSSYVVSEKTNKSTITLFTNFTTPDNKGLFITRGDPNSIRNTVSFLNAQAVLLKQNRAKEFENIPDLEGLTTKIKKFTKENKNSVIVLDRVDYLITNFSFEQFAKTLYQITDIISENNALLLFHIDPELLDDREMAIITNELQPLPSQKIEDLHLKDELYDILRFINEQNQRNIAVSFKKVGKECSIVDKTTTKRLRILKDEGLIFVKKLGRVKALNISEKGKTLLHKREIV